MSRLFRLSDWLGAAMSGDSDHAGRMLVKMTGVLNQVNYAKTAVDTMGICLNIL